jgi:hypothetical protein
VIRSVLRDSDDRCAPLAPPGRHAVADLVRRTREDGVVVHRDVAGQRESLLQTRRRLQISMGADFERYERWRQRLRLGSSLPWLGVRPVGCATPPPSQLVVRWHITR